MAGDDKHAPRRSAQTGGDQRRRLVRRSSVSRSRTTPNFNIASIATFEGSEYLGYGANARGGATSDQGQEGTSNLETSQFTMNFYPPTGIPADLRPTTSGALSIHGSASPTPSGGSEPSTKLEGNKKHSRKIKDFVLGSNKQLPSPPQPTPLPPSTPTKAAKLLGVASDPALLASPRSSQHDGSTDSAYDGRVWDIQGLPQQHSTSTLMRPASSNVVTNEYRDSRFREEDIDDDLTKPKNSKSFWSNSKKLTKKMSGYLSSTIRNHPKTPSPFFRSPRLKFYDSPPSSRYLETDFVYSNEQDLDDSYSVGPRRTFAPPFFAQPLLAPPPFAPPPVPEHPVPAANSRRRAKRRGRKAKGLDEMAPITEASYDDISAAYHGGEDTSESDVISSYAQDIPPRSASLQPHLRPGYQTTSQPGEYELQANEMSSGEEDADMTLTEEKEKDVTDDGDDAKWQRPTPVYLRSPLQNVEDRLLDAAEEKLKYTNIKEDSSPEEEDYLVHGSTASLSKAKQSIAAPDDDYTQAATQEDFDRRFAAISKVVSGLKANHEKMKEDFTVIVKKQDEGEIDDDSEDDDDLPSLRSSIDLSEEPTVHIATAMTITRVTPGMVKLVDIPPRRK
ncbi:hypothetical protein FB567DRAFT_620837 [Paraphoma chrysanthemicola]|uniref:Uncharacterized protein n=1 Tax=Paraphoma chrysanthemicola TaxID=798071 RepID=A0A8K0VYZ0_9PLEO|nr:hypothetical protein FB567DRAFT_620837 [Paraphoma chrysanthemicola]